MRLNAIFRYKKSSTASRDSNGCLIATEASDFAAGSYCQADKVAPAKHKIGTDGQEFVYDYTIYMERKYADILEIGDTLELSLFGGPTETKTIIGIDATDRKVLAVWV